MAASRYRGRMNALNVPRMLDASLPQDEWLTSAEVEELTGCQQPAAQQRTLERYGLRCFRRPDGRVIVSRWAVRFHAAGAGAEEEPVINWPTQAKRTHVDILRPQRKSPGSRG